MHERIGTPIAPERGQWMGIGACMTKAMTAGLAFLGCWTTAMCLAYPVADRAVAVPEAGRGSYSAVGAPQTSAQGGKWSSAIELLSPYRVYPSVLDVDWLSDRFLRDPANTRGTGLGLGYSWRNMRLEGALVHMREGGALSYGAGAPRLFTTTTSRLSYQLSSNLMFQIARGHLNRQNVTDADDDVRRNSITASYNRPFEGNNWQTIMAIGRNTGRADGGGNNKVYLLESSLRFARMHTVFARLERASVAEFFTDRDALLYGQNFNANRLTFGYVYVVPLGARSQMTFGSVIAKRSMPQEAAAILRSDPPFYKVFTRFSLQMP